MSLVVLPRQFLVDINGNPRVGAKVFIYASGTTTPITVYTTPAYAVAHSNPILSVASGLFPAIYANPSVNATYKMVIKDSADVTLYTEDNIPALGFTQSDIAQILYPQTDEETAAGLTAINFQYEPLDVWRYLSTAQIEDVSSGTSAIDVSSIIQDVIDFASSLMIEMNAYNPGAVAQVKVRAGRYRIGTGLTMADNDAFCHIVGEDTATFYFVGTGACLHIGNGLSYGILPASVRRINFEKADTASGSVGLKIEDAANGVYEAIGVNGFETGIHIKGGINILLDGQRHALNGCTYGILVESSQGSDGGLRLSNNILTIKNYLIHSGTVNGITVRTGSGVTPIGAGGTLTIENCTFEQLNSSGRSLYFSCLGEIPLYDEAIVRSCHFEFYGSTLMSIDRSRVVMENCFIANGGSTIFEMLEDTSYLTVIGTHGYFTDTQPTSNIMVKLGGTATSAVYANLRFERCSFPPVAKLHASYPSTDYGLVIRTPQTFEIEYNATYPVGNVVTNNGLVLSLFTEADKFIGTGWHFCDVTFVGNDGTSNIGRVSLRLYKYNNGYNVKDLDGNLSDYSLANTTASNATITFVGTNGRFNNMIGTFTHY
jgi:hypothetical protein